MTATHTIQTSSISPLLDHAPGALGGEDFSGLVHSALRLTDTATDFDDCFVELRTRLHALLFEPPGNVTPVEAALTRTGDVDRLRTGLIQYEQAAKLAAER